MASFFEAERNHAGWRFGLLWIVMTLVSFALGIILEWLLSGTPTLYFAVPLASLAQGWVLNRHIPIYVFWTASTTIAWLIGLFVTRAIIGALLPEPNLWLELGTATVTAGILAGFLQWFFIREWLPSIGIWWIIIGAMSWQLPGIISALVLTPFITYDKVDLTGKRFILSNEGATLQDISQTG
jgi:hypothetical protein